MAIDTEAKRWSMLNVAAGPAAHAQVFNPDTSGLVFIERATVLKLYGGNAFDPAVITPVYGWGARGRIGKHTAIDTHKRIGTDTAIDTHKTIGSSTA